jgi:hypothetical protein
MESLVERSRARPYERMTVQYPYPPRHEVCLSCKMQFPAGLQNCPYCGASQAPPQPQQDNKPATTPFIDPFDQQVLDYITARNGTISISQAAKDLSMEPGTLRMRLERLKASGLLRTT